MKSWLLGVQSLFMRGVGVRKLNQALNLKSDAVHSDLAARIDALGGQLSQQGRSDTERGDAIQSMLSEIHGAIGELTGHVSRQGQADTERGDTIQNMLSDLRTAVGDLAGQVSGLHENEGHHRLGVSSPIPSSGVKDRARRSIAASAPLLLSPDTSSSVDRLRVEVIQLGRETTQQLHDFLTTLSLQTAASEVALGRIASSGADTSRVVAAVDAKLQIITEKLATSDRHVELGFIEPPKAVVGRTGPAS